MQPPMTAKNVDVLEATQRLLSDQGDEGAMAEQLFELSAAQVALIFHNLRGVG